ncbi:MAG: ATP-binding protein [Bdellovibrionia bacterium]
MIIAIWFASGITPKLIHVNYDSIASARQMNTSWNAIKHPEEHQEKSPEIWMELFTQALTFAEGNITEAGERQIVRNIRNVWDLQKGKPHEFKSESFKHMENYLADLIAVNENGMFRLAAESNALSRQALVVGCCFFLLSIFLTLYLADNLAIKIVTPLKDLAETLRRKPVPGSKLKLPQPTSLETSILTQEFSRLWERLSELQKLNLEEIFSQGKKLEAILASVEDAILVLDNEERIVLYNSGIKMLVGMDFKNMLGQRWSDLSTSSDNYLKLRNLLKPNISSDQTVELQFGNRSRIFSGRTKSFFGEKGEQIGRLYLLHDITEIKQRERLKAEFIGILSHELKTPLQSLGTASELLLDRRSKMSDEEKMLIETIHEDVGRIKGVANEFVQVGLVDLHSLKLKMERLPISELITQWVQPFQVLARDKNVKVEIIKEGSQIIFGQIDAVKFPWAISNLVANAIRVSPTKSTVTIHLTDRERRVDIEVRDEGPGVPDNIQKKMFDPYFQGGSEQSGFLGLGLTVTKEVVEAHDGRIDYFPRNPNGAIFRISLPMPQQF